MTSAHAVRTASLRRAVAVDGRLEADGLEWPRWRLPRKKVKRSDEVGRRRRRCRVALGVAVPAGCRRIRAGGRSAQGDPRARRRHQARRRGAGPARHHRLGQDVHRRQRDRRDRQADADHRAQQDPRGAAVRRVQGAVPRQRRPLLRQLLRLLPARGVRPDDRHVHREGLDRQRGDRSHAPRGDVRAAVAQGRDHRRLGVVHLRHRRSRDVRGDDVRARGRRRRSIATPCCAGSSSCSTSATTSTSTAARSACAATPSRCSRPTRPTPRSASSGGATRSRR